MDQQIVRFIDLLRQNEVRVGMSEALDAFRAAELVGLNDREAFRAALKTTLIKGDRDGKTFDSVFDLYFRGMGEKIRAALENPDDKRRAEESQLWDEMAQALDDQEMSPLMEALLRNDTARLEQMLQQAAQKTGADQIASPFQEGYYSYRMSEELDWYNLRFQMQQNVARLRGKGYRQLAEKLERVGDQRMRMFQEVIKEYVRREFEKTHHDFRKRFQEKSILDKSFFSVNPDELRRMEDVVRTLAEKLKARVTMRRKRTKRRGTLNVQATIRKNIGLGGVPFHIEFRRKKKERPELVVLCDVSDSVRQASAFMLRFVYSVQELFSRVRSFIFVSDIGEVTELFKEQKDPGKALEQAFNGAVINVWQNSNFGKAFADFHRDQLHTINKRTTVIILGDGRNNYNPPNDWVLRDIQQKAKKLIWLNPEGKRSWGVGDSEMPRYLRWCDMAEEVRTLNQLRRVIDSIVL